jgi:hypothetical protein
MELLIIVAALCLLGVLANRYGHDSRDRLRPAEERFSAHRLDWAARD